MKRIGNVYLGEEQTHENDWWSEEASVWWSKGKKGRKGLSKGKNKISESDSRTFLQKKGSDKDLQSNKGERKDQRRKKEKKVPILNEDILPQNRQVKKDVAILGNLMTGIPALLILPAPLLIGIARDILHGWRQFP